MEPFAFPYPENADEMVAEQIVPRGIKDSRVIEAMRKVPRHLFVPEEYRHLAYTDQPLPIGFGQTISQPYVVAFMTEALQIGKNSKVLEIGTGSGYQAAILGEIAKEVYTVEIIATLSEKAKEVCDKLGYKNIFFKIGNGRDGWEEKAPFTHIIVTAASSDIPEKLIEQLDEGGRMIIPLGSLSWGQDLVLVSKKHGKITKEKILPVRFVPLVKSREDKSSKAQKR